MKNIILDIGGILFDDSKNNINKLLNKDASLIYKMAFGEYFKQCLLGYETVSQYIEKLKSNQNYEDIKYILSKENLKLSFPLIKENYEYIKLLKDKGYKIYLLSNITEDSYNYINGIIDIDNTFDGGVYSFKEHVIKPGTEIYKIIINRYNLNLKETIFFDDSQKNVDAAMKENIYSVKFNSLNDIKKYVE